MTAASDGRQRPGIDNRGDLRRPRTQSGKTLGFPGCLSLAERHACKLRGRCGNSAAPILLFPAPLRNPPSAAPAAPRTRHAATRPPTAEQRYESRRRISITRPSPPQSVCCTLSLPQKGRPGPRDRPESFSIDAWQARHGIFPDEELESREAVRIPTFRRSANRYAALNTCEAGRQPEETVEMTAQAPRSAGFPLPSGNDGPSRSIKL
jgi:hypothetical protein